ncbi:hypothetical protein PBRA_008737 [Plasmodiophora brassicae]|uniref:C2 domain-containing protein n=1 Tax=Plasmodiophora brassicae TaxID=37360 RepID=A0A0G4J2L9_PLABS|nr:hypothetical protein PBRA_008737 [Plasmodiophora brassicae]
MPGADEPIVQLLEVSLGACSAPADLARFVVVVAGAEPVEVVLDDGRWSLDGGSQSSPVYIPVGADVAQVVVQVWSTKSGNVPAASVAIPLQSIAIGQSTTVPVQWAAESDASRCSVIASKARAFQPNRFPSDLQWNPAPDPVAEVDIFVYRATNVDVDATTELAVLARAPGFTQASTGSMKVNRYRGLVSNKWVKLLPEQGAATATTGNGSLQLSLVPPMASAAPAVAFAPVPWSMVSPAVQCNLIIPSQGSSASLFVSVTPTQKQPGELSLLQRNAHLAKVVYNIRSISGLATAETVFITVYLCTNIEDYRRKVLESRNLWPPFPFARLEPTSSTLSGGDTLSPRIRVTDEITKDRFSAIAQSVTLFDREDIVFGPATVALAELYTNPTPPDNSFRFIGYASVPVADLSSPRKTAIVGTTASLEWAVTTYRSASAPVPASESTLPAAQPPAANIGNAPIQAGVTLPPVKPPVSTRRPFKVMHIIRSPKAVAVESTRIADLQNQLADAKQQLKVEMETRAKAAHDLEAKVDALRTLGLEIIDLRRVCEQLRNENRSLTSRLNEYTSLEKSSIAHAPEDTPSNVAALRTLLLRARHEIAVEKQGRSEALRKVERMSKQVEAARQTQRNFAKLREAHAAQSACLRSVQDDRKRIDKFHKTIETQESVIEQLEALLRAAAPSDDSRAEGTTKHADPQAQARALAAEARCQALEAELQSAADLYGRDVSALKAEILMLKATLPDPDLPSDGDPNDEFVSSPRSTVLDNY